MDLSALPYNTYVACQMDNWIFVQFLNNFFLNLNASLVTHCFDLLYFKLWVVEVQEIVAKKSVAVDPNSLSTALLACMIGLADGFIMYFNGLFKIK